MNSKTKSPIPLATGITAAAASTGSSPIRLLPLFPAATSALFALQSHTDASIIYSGVQNFTVSGAGTPSTAIGRTLLFGGGGLDLTVRRHLVGNPMHATVNIEAVSGELLLNASHQLQKLAAGAAISSGKFPGHSGTIGNLAVYRAGALHTGTWLGAQTGLAAFQLNNGNLGWVRLEWTSADHQPYPSDLTAIDWAYDDTPGEAIRAGQTSAAPEPSSTALLALAGAGAAFLRCRRQVGAS